MAGDDLFVNVISTKLMEEEDLEIHVLLRSNLMKSMVVGSVGSHEILMKSTGLVLEDLFEQLFEPPRNHSSI
jgi:hypothetical protein